MSESVTSVRPAIGFAFGDPAAAAHVREALADQVEIAYAAPGAEFDPAQLASANVSAVLVNVDAGDWFEPLATRLAAAGVNVVLNDPETSSALQGWELARWQRHLVGKLRGSADFDPPRPATVATPALQAGAAGVDEQPISGAAMAPLTAASEAVVPVPDAPAAAAPDIDTEALSAMIDARLAAAPEGGLADAPAWEVIAPPPAPDAPPLEAATTGTPEIHDRGELPVVDGLELIDGDALPVAPKAAVVTRSAEELSIDVTGLELMPLDTSEPSHRPSPSIERWLNKAERTARPATPAKGKGHKA